MRKLTEMGVFVVFIILDGLAKVRGISSRHICHYNYTSVSGGSGSMLYAIHVLFLHVLVYLSFLNCLRILFFYIYAGFYC